MKRDEISLREFIVRRHQFQLKRRRQKSSWRTVWRKRAVSRWVLLTRSEKYHLPTACRFYSPEERKEKSCCLCACNTKNTIQKSSWRTVWRKRAVSRWVLLTRSEKYHLPTACRFYSPEERKEKSCCLCACYLLFDPRYQPVINSKIIEDEAIYNFWRFLVEAFFLPVIKPPGTYFNDKLLPSDFLLSCLKRE